MQLKFAHLVYYVEIWIMTAKQRDKYISHWRKVIKKIEKNREFLTDRERQQRDYAYSRIEDIREEWRLSKIES